jgi:transcriptional regulator with XRE-family HTH domain
MSDIPTQIRAALERTNISVNELARRADMSPRQLRKVLAGDGAADETLVKIARGLGVELTRPAVVFHPDGRVQCQ